MWYEDSSLDATTITIADVYPQFLIQALTYQSCCPIDIHVRYRHSFLVDPPSPTRSFRRGAATLDPAPSIAQVFEKMYKVTSEISDLWMLYMNFCLLSNRMNVGLYTQRWCVVAHIAQPTIGTDCH